MVAGRTSVAVTTAPRRRAVAMACRPATPTPMMKTLAGGNRARRGHHHRQGLAEQRGGIDRRPCSRRGWPGSTARPWTARALMRGMNSMEKIEALPAAAPRSRLCRRRDRSSLRRSRRASSARIPRSSDGGPSGGCQLPQTPPLPVATISAPCALQRRVREARSVARTGLDLHLGAERLSFFTVSGDTATRGSSAPSAVTAMVTIDPSVDAVWRLTRSRGSEIGMPELSSATTPVRHERR